MKYRLGILATHPIQYYVPWYRALAAHPEIDLEVFYAHQQSASGQADAGYGVPFEWDIPLLDGYTSLYLTNVARTPDVSSFFGCDTPDIETILSQRRFDAFIVQGWSSKSYWQAMRACRRVGTPVFVRGDSHLHTRRSWIRRLLKYPIYRWFLPRFDRYLVVGLWNKEYYVHYGADPRKMFSVPHSVDNAFFESRAGALRPNRAALRELAGIPDNAFVFAFAGRLVPAKRPMDFVYALRDVASHHPLVYGLVVGNGRLRASMEVFARQHRLPIRFVGFLNQTEIPRAYAMADALVLPSRIAETWGLVVNEAMASGLPVIASDGVGCVPDLIQPGETGYVFPAQDIPALATAMAELAGFPETSRAMGAMAQARVQKFSVTQAVEGTVAALKSLKVVDISPKGG